MIKRVSSLWTYPLKYGYITCIGILALMASFEEAKEARFMILAFGALIVLLNYVFYHNLATVYQLSDGLRFNRSKKEFTYPFSEIEEIVIERFVNCQPVRIKMKDGESFRFVSIGTLFWANEELIEEIKNMSNQTSLTTPEATPPTS
ncbi:hypothetical protein [Pelagicoccus albus]|uniref:Uncharacterized protein n=1 Tax=Pelagicoccus albus TaxID=415222 RepID=A0A7X1B374_9BACT|nr:hypothetical protein [Pelagicoccus albus]MBC2604816.1 hypothetical protein [Pelagicoccus albus]